MELPTDGQPNCPLVATRSAHFYFYTPTAYAAGASPRCLMTVSSHIKFDQEEALNEV